MTIHPTDDRITSDVTAHTATRSTAPVPGEPGWSVSWLPGRVVDYSAAVSAMMIADLATSIADDEAQGRTVSDDDERRTKLAGLAHGLGMSGAEAERLARCSPVQDADAEVHDTHAIPADDEPAADQKYLPGDWVDLTLRNARVFGVGATDEHSVLMVGHDAMPEIASIALTDDVIVTVLVRTRAEVPSPSDLHVEPAKTHDLTIRREFGNVVVRAEAATGNRVVYLQDGAARDLGRVLDALTPAQRQLLIGELKGGKK